MSTKTHIYEYKDGGNFENIQSNIKGFSKIEDFIKAFTDKEGFDFVKNIKLFLYQGTENKNGCDVENNIYVIQQKSNDYDNLESERYFFGAEESNNKNWDLRIYRVERIVTESFSELK